MLKFNVISAIPSGLVALTTVLKFESLATSKGEPNILPSAIRKPGGKLPLITVTVTSSILSMGRGIFCSVLSCIDRI